VCTSRYPLDADRPAKQNKRNLSGARDFEDTARYFNCGRDHQGCTYVCTPTTARRRARTTATAAAATASSPPRHRPRRPAVKSREINPRASRTRTSKFTKAAGMDQIYHLSRLRRRELRRRELLLPPKKLLGLPRLLRHERGDPLAHPHATIRATQSCAEARAYRSQHAPGRGGSARRRGRRWWRRGGRRRAARRRR
jgi:hypothetical protein